MNEPKAETATRVADLKKREGELAESRNALRTQIVGLIDGHVAELREIGFDYVVTEKGPATPKIGRPKKGAPNAEKV